jgi:methylenetetrahydrofolate dehydrogenase (NADP+)/methenyltetrahydrofolate cyclohydrolase
MTAAIIDGKAIAEKVREEVRQAVARMQEDHGYTPGLATVLVGENPASATYVRSKRKTCEELGIRSIGHELPADATQQQVEKLVADLSANPNVNGILVQLPLPKHLDEEAVLNTVSIEKDVDGFHPVNIGRLAMKGRDPLFIPCTPYGCIVLLEESGITMRGADAVVVGRSNIVGLPVAMLLQKRDATVTICHSRTRDLADTHSPGRHRHRRHRPDGDDHRRHDQARCGGHRRRHQSEEPTQRQARLSAGRRR